MQNFSRDRRTLTENEFCDLMQNFETTSETEFTDEQQYDMFLDRLFYRIKHKKSDQVQISGESTTGYMLMRRL